LSDELIFGISISTQLIFVKQKKVGRGGLDSSVELQGVGKKLGGPVPCDYFPTNLGFLFSRKDLAAS
jgi:hypothetical protein